MSIETFVLGPITTSDQFVILSVTGPSSSPQVSYLNGVENDGRIRYYLENDLNNITNVPIFRLGVVKQISQEFVIRDTTNNVYMTIEHEPNPSASSEKRYILTSGSGTRTIELYQNINIPSYTPWNSPNAALTNILYNLKTPNADKDAEVHTSSSGSAARTAYFYFIPVTLYDTCTSTTNYNSVTGANEIINSWNCRLTGTGTICDFGNKQMWTRLQDCVNDILYFYCGQDPNTGELYTCGEDGGCAGPCSGLYTCGQDPTGPTGDFVCLYKGSTGSNLPNWIWIAAIITGVILLLIIIGCIVSAVNRTKPVQISNESSTSTPPK